MAQGIQISSLPTSTGGGPTVDIRPIQYDTNISQGLRGFNAELALAVDPVGSFNKGMGQGLQNLRSSQDYQQSRKLFPRQIAEADLELAQKQAQNELYQAQMPALMEDAKLTADQRAERETQREINKAITIDDAKTTHELEKLDKIQVQETARLEKQHAQEMEQLQSKAASAEELQTLAGRQAQEREQLRAGLQSMRGIQLSGARGSGGTKGSQGENLSFAEKERFKAQAQVDAAEEKEKTKYGFKQADKLDKFFRDETDKAKNNIQSANTFKQANSRMPTGAATTFHSNFLGGNYFNKDIALMNQAQFELLFSNKPPGLGVMSDADKVDLLKRGLSIKNPKEVNDFIADRAITYNQSVLDSKSYWNRLKSKEGASKAGRDFESNWNKYETDQPYFTRTPAGELAPNPYRVPPEIYFGEREATGLVEKAKLALWKKRDSMTPEQIAEAAKIVESNSPVQFIPPWEQGLQKPKSQEEKAYQTSEEESAK